MLRQKTKGQGLTEFALILPILLLLILGIVEAAWLIWVYITVQNAAREATRYAITGAPLNDTGDPWTFTANQRLPEIIQVARQAAGTLPVDRNADWVQSEAELGAAFGTGMPCNGMATYFECYQNTPRALGIMVRGQRPDESTPNDPTDVVVVNNYPGDKGLNVEVEVYYNAPMLDPILNAVMGGNTIRATGRVLLQNEGLNLALGDALPPQSTPLPDNIADTGGGGSGPTNVPFIQVFLPDQANEQLEEEGTIPAGTRIDINLNIHEWVPHYVCFGQMTLPGSPYQVLTNQVSVPTYTIADFTDPGIYTIKSITKDAYESGLGCNALAAATFDLTITPSANPVIAVYDPGHSVHEWPDNSLVKVLISGHDPNNTPQTYQIFFNGNPMLTDAGGNCMITTSTDGYARGTAECVIPNGLATGVYSMTSSLASTNVEVSTPSLYLIGGDTWPDDTYLNVTLLNHAPNHDYYIYYGNTAPPATLPPDGIKFRPAVTNPIKTNEDGKMEVSLEIPKGYQGQMYLISMDANSVPTDASPQREIAKTTITVNTPTTPFITVAGCGLTGTCQQRSGEVVDLRLRSHRPSAVYDVKLASNWVDCNTATGAVDPCQANASGDSLWFGYKIPIALQGTTTISSFMKPTSGLSATREIQILSSPYIALDNGNKHSPGARVNASLQNHLANASYDIYINYFDPSGGPFTLSGATRLVAGAVTDNNGDFDFEYDIPLTLPPTDYNTSGPRYVLVSVRSNNIVATADLYVVVADLRVTAITKPANPQPGLPIPIDITVINSSAITIANQPFDTDLYLKNTPNYSSFLPPGDDKIWLDAIAPAQSRVITGFETTVFNTGVYTLYGRTDTSGNIVESLEYNNILSGSMTITCSLTPFTDTFNNNNVTSPPSGTSWTITAFGTATYAQLGGESQPGQAVAMAVPIATPAPVAGAEYAVAAESWPAPPSTGEPKPRAVGTPMPNAAIAANAYSDTPATPSARLIDPAVFRVPGPTAAPVPQPNPAPAEIRPQIALAPNPAPMAAEALIPLAQTTNTVRDEFNSRAYNNNNGTQSWAGNWTETGETSSSATAGDIQVVTDLSNYQLRVVRITQAVGATVYRAVNLANMAEATLSLDYRRVNLDDTSEGVRLEFSNNGGSSWTTINNFTGNATDSAYQSYSVSIPSTYFTSNTRIRFITYGVETTTEGVYFDNVEIEYVTNVAPTAINLLVNGQASPATVTAQSPVFSWDFSDPNPGQTQTGWDIDVSLNSGFSSTVWNPGQQNSTAESATYAGTTLTDNTTYYWRIQTRDNLNLWSTAWVGGQFTTRFNDAPSLPTNLQTNGATNPVLASLAAPTLSWQFNDADTPYGDTQGGYQVQVSTVSNNFTSPIWDSGQVTDTDSSAVYGGPALANNTIYYWQVRTRDAAGVWSNYSTVQTFFATTFPVPSGLTVTGSRISGSVAMTLGWTDSTTAETGFRIERSPNGTGSWTQIGTVAANTVSYLDNGSLSCGQRYYYRVTSYNSAGNIGASNINYGKVGCSPLSAPLELAATTATSTSIRLDWGHNPGTLVGGVEVADHAFEFDAEGFTYTDTDATNAALETGSYTSTHQALMVDLGSRTRSSGTVYLQGEWNEDFTLATAQNVTIQFSYRIQAYNNSGTITNNYDTSNGEYAVAMVAIDGSTPITSSSSVVGGSSADTGWATASQTFSLAAGTRTLRLIGANRSSDNTENALIFFDNVRIIGQQVGITPDQYIIERVQVATSTVQIIDHNNALWSSATVLPPISYTNPAVFTNTNLTCYGLNGPLYHYRARAYLSTDGSYSDYSNIDYAFTGPCSPLVAPSQLNVTKIVTGGTAIYPLTWVDNSSNETSFRVERATNAPNFWEPVATLSANTTAYTDTASCGGAVVYYRVVAYRASDNLEVESINPIRNNVQTNACPAATPTPNPGQLPTPTPTPTRTAQTCTASGESGGTLTLCSSGRSTMNSNDSGVDSGYVFMNRQLTNSASFEMVVRLLSVPNLSGDSRAGLEVRESLATNARKVQLVVRHSNTQQIGAFTRGTAGGSVAQVESWKNTGGDVPMWLRIVRANGRFYFYYNAVNGADAPAIGAWTLLGSTSDAMGTNVYVGLINATFNTSTNKSASTWQSFSVGCVANSAAICGTVTEDGGLIKIDALNYVDNFAGTNGNIFGAGSRTVNSVAYPYMRYTGSDYRSLGYEEAAPMVEYSVSVQQSGTYYVWVLGYTSADDTDGIHVGVNGQTVSSADNMDRSRSTTATRVQFGTSYLYWFNGTSNDGNTASGPRASLSLKQGINTINVWGRDDQFELIQILLTTDPYFKPTSTKYTQSDCLVPVPPEFPPLMQQCTNMLKNTSFEDAGSFWSWTGGGARASFPYPDPGTSWSTIMPSVMGNTISAPYLTQSFELPAWMLDNGGTTAILDMHKAVNKQLNPNFLGVDSPTDYLYAALVVKDGATVITLTDRVLLATGADLPADNRTNIDPKNPDQDSLGKDDWVRVKKDLFTYASKLPNYTNKNAELIVYAPNPGTSSTDSNRYSTDFYVDKVQLEICTTQPRPGYVNGTGSIEGQLVILSNGLQRKEGIKVWAYKDNGPVFSTFTVNSKSPNPNFGFYNLDPGLYRVYAEYTDTSGFTFVQSKSVSVVESQTATYVPLTLEQE